MIMSHVPPKGKAIFLFSEISFRLVFLVRLQVWRKYTSLLTTNQKPILIAVGCAVAQNLTAANSVVYFAIDIFRLAGVCDPYLAGAGVGGMKVHLKLFELYWRGEFVARS